MKPIKRFRPLMINGNDVRIWGVIITDNTIGQLMAPPAMKDYLSFSCRNEHGSHYLANSSRCDSRDFTLELRMIATDASVMYDQFDEFLSELQKGKLSITSDYITGRTFDCIFKSISTFTRFNGNAITFALKLVEYNPQNRIINPTV